ERLRRRRPGAQPRRVRRPERAVVAAGRGRQAVHPPGERGQGALPNELGPVPGAQPRRGGGPRPDPAADRSGRGHEGRKGRGAQTARRSAV
ncbi:MAG: hypothetical protein AVDCRST_MAG93-1812, partial [uncultured Chloroflexia bacterium]